MRERKQLPPPAHWTHCVVYRKGGTDNFTWHRSLAMTREAAEEGRATVIKMGYPAFVVNYAHSMAIGLPEGYEWRAE